MLSEKETDNLYQLLSSKANTESIQLALEIIESNQVGISLELYDQLIEIAQEIELEGSLDLNDLKSADLVSKIQHINNAKAISIDHIEQLPLLAARKYFNEIMTIDCWSLKLQEIPKTIEQYDHLKYLNFGNNRIKNYPNYLEDLPLVRLNLFSNRLKKFPAFVFDSDSLEELQLGANQIKEIPEQIRKMTQLKYLGLTDNKIERLPTALYELKSLEVLSLTGNPLDLEDVKALKAALPKTSIYFA